MTKLIFGIGNYGPEFYGTRHNLGSSAALYLAEDLQIQMSSSRHYCSGRDKQVIIAINKGFINEAGFPLKQCMKDYNVQVEDIIVLHDDLQLPLGKIMLREQGSLLGHNGLKHIAGQLCTQSFCRLRLGIGRPLNQSVRDYVLSMFKQSEYICIEQCFRELKARINTLL